MTHISRPILHYAEMSSNEQDLLSPALWDGRSIGLGETQPYEPLRLSSWNLLQLARASLAVGTAIGRAQVDVLGSKPALTFGWGSTFPGIEFSGLPVVYDQEMLVSRGEEPYAIDPREFIAMTGFPNKPDTPITPHQIIEPHVRYLRTPAAQAELMVGDGARLALATGMNPDKKAGYTEQLSALAIPHEVVVGEVSHYAIGDTGYELLTRTRQVTVYSH